MKISTCIVASDLNPMYYLFFPIVKKFWQKINIKTYLILISTYIPDDLIAFKDDIILFPPLDDIPTAFQAQNIRILYPCLMEKEKDGIILSDMDLIPLNYDYFHKNVENVDAKQSFIVYRNVIEHEKEYPICFCLATQQTWYNIFHIHNMEEIRMTLQEWYKTIPCNDYQISSPYSYGWSFDQKKLFTKVNACEKMNLILLKDKETKFQRLNRDERMNNDFKFLVEIRNKIKANYYSDFHLPRPFHPNKNILNFILDESF